MLCFKLLTSYKIFKDHDDTKIFWKNSLANIKSYVLLEVNYRFEFVKEYSC